jgi:hypothetical protein
MNGERHRVAWGERPGTSRDVLIHVKKRNGKVGTEPRRRVVVMSRSAGNVCFLRKTFDWFGACTVYHGFLRHIPPTSRSRLSRSRPCFPVASWVARCVRHFARPSWAPPSRLLPGLSSAALAQRWHRARDIRGWPCADRAPPAGIRISNGHHLASTEERARTAWLYRSGCRAGGDRPVFDGTSSTTAASSRAGKSHYIPYGVDCEKELNMGKIARMYLDPYADLCAKGI